VSNAQHDRKQRVLDAYRELGEALLALEDDDLTPDGLYKLGSTIVSLGAHVQMQATLLGASTPEEDDEDEDWAADEDAEAVER
jgi:hypothetical protein